MTKIHEEIHRTADGSITLKDSATGELYHNRAGAYTEALENFVEPLNLADSTVSESTISFLDVCFGLGYNTFVLLNEITKLEIRASVIEIVAIEKFEKPLLYLTEVLNDERFAELKKQINKDAPALARGEFGEHSFSLQCKSSTVAVKFMLIQGDLREVVPNLVSSRTASLAQPERLFLAVFHDAFSPQRAPELWSIDLFACYRKLLVETHGKIVTYSAASAIRSAFKQCGFIVKRTTAVGAKNGGTLAMLNSMHGTSGGVEPLLEDEERKLAGRAGVPYRDPFFCKTSKEILKDRDAEQQSLFPI